MSAHSLCPGDCYAPPNSLLVCRLRLRHRSLRPPPFSWPRARMHLCGHLEHRQTSVAGARAVQAVADASRAMLVHDGPRQTGSNSHQPAFVLHGEPPKTSVGA